MVFESLGYLAGVFYIVCYLPQIYGIFTNRSNKLDIRMIYLQGIAATLMVSYATLNNLYPIILLNILTLVCLIIIWCGTIGLCRPIESAQ